MIESSPPRVSSPPPGLDSDNDMEMPDSRRSSLRPSDASLRPRRMIQTQSKRRQVTIRTSDLPDSDSASVGDLIWGTNIDMEDVGRRFLRFLATFQQDGEPLYPLLIQDALDAEIPYLNLDMNNVCEFDPELYAQTANFPAEVLPTFDAQVEAFAEEHFQELMQENGIEKVDLWTRPFHLREVKSMRAMDPSDIDRLVAVRGMVIRSSAVLPDIQTAFFRCTLCAQTQAQIIESGRIEEPLKCPNQACQGSNTMQLVHNRCQFQDKQLVKIQETPENIPDGETPQTIDVYVYQELVDACKPGDRVEVTGVYRAAPIRKNPRKRSIQAVYKTYVDCVHVRKWKSTKFVDQEAVELVREDADEELKNAFGADDDIVMEDPSATDESSAHREKRIKEIQELAANPEVYEILTRSFAPSIWEMDDVKKGILCQLMGGTDKDLTGFGGGRFRNQLNILLCGDPGTSKSQLLQYVHKIAPRGIYTSGKGSSAVGLTAYITKDPDSGDLVLESGALVLSDKGICCIDEFDKMSDSARSILHEVMEQQTVSIAKAGIICTLNARTSILAAANPIESRYNPNKSVVENIDLPPTLMSRFDLIYLVLDRPNEVLDRRLAGHLVGLYHSEDDKARREGDALPTVPQDLFMDFIAYSRKHIQPRISEAAGEELVKSYMELRGYGQRKSITATPRQLESLIRLSEALARMRHDDYVRERDVREAMRLHKVATLHAATDPRTGAIDLDCINVGLSMEDERVLQERAAAVQEVLLNHRGPTIRVSKILRRYNEPRDAEDEIGFPELQKVIQKLEQLGKVRAPGDWLSDNPVVTIIDRSAIDAQ